mmetsp:Transcript_46942/g.109756  ORF Transcript_46942/g.109756 Transcript_46942/m.109756 type:complete len:203 (-) Transcript_46942:141-749(-)
MNESVPDTALQVLPADQLESQVCRSRTRSTGDLAPRYCSSGSELLCPEAELPKWTFNEAARLRASRQGLDQPQTLKRRGKQPGPNGTGIYHEVRRIWDADDLVKADMKALVEFLDDLPHRGPVQLNIALEVLNRIHHGLSHVDADKRVLPSIGRYNVHTVTDHLPDVILLPLHESVNLRQFRFQEVAEGTHCRFLFKLQHLL